MSAMYQFVRSDATWPALFGSGLSRLGSAKTISFSGRIIAATNRNLGAKVIAGEFRDDLLFRLKVGDIHMPSLKGRKAADIPLLVNHFLIKHRKEHRVTITSVTLEAWNLLQSYDWPGNVRELENVIKSAGMRADTSVVTSDLIELPQVESNVLETEIYGSKGETVFPSLIPTAGSVAGDYCEHGRNCFAHHRGNLDGAILCHTRFYIKRALYLSNGNQSKAAEIIGMSEDKLRRKMKKQCIVNELRRHSG